MKDKQIFIIRHGETDLNRKGIIQGRGVDSPLNETGRKQALAFYHHYRHITFDRIYTSTLRRTIETVEPFLKTHKRVLHLAELDEISWGNQEGKLPDNATRKAFYDVLSQWKAGILDAAVDGGESPLMLARRQRIFIDRYLKEDQGNILICMHGRAMRSLLCLLTNKPLHLMDDFPHKNLTLYKLSVKNGRVSIDLFNDTKHLDGKV